MLLNIRIFFCRIFQRPLFIIKIENKSAVCVAGKAPSSFIQDCRDVALLNQVQTGFVYAQHFATGKPMVFGSREISRETLQQLRNSWNA
jgi:Protein of unknown function (DUF3634)